METQIITAIDIGTRSVVGVTIQKYGDQYKIIAAAVEEHKERAMYDGQIHDIPLVAEAVKKIKQALEKNSGQRIEYVAVAAAGRALKTARGSIKVHQELHEITEHDIVALEIQAVQNAEDNLKAGTVLETEYHCVGYSVLHYSLDNYHLSNLLGQTGEEVEIEVIATFLPRAVIDSLYAVLSRANLKILSLTLEPIAAAELAIPLNMRQLNLALIDIGAGTSDIAITSHGAINAYAMVPYAGDEVTEKIADSFLLSFQTAEKAKKELSKPLINFTDVVGFVHEVPAEEVLEKIKETVDHLAKEIAISILELNGKAPQAVICVGGGSLTPGLAARIASNLELPANRVGIKGKEALTGIVGSIKKLSGPQMITPLGIAIKSFKSTGLSFCEVTVNNTPVRLLAVKELRIADALLAAGINLKTVLGKPGKALTVIINGEVTFLRGLKGKPAEIYLNNKPAKLDDLLQHGDNIQFTPAINGTDREAALREIEDIRPINFVFNGTEHTLYPRVKINGREVSDFDTMLVDNSHIEFKPQLDIAYILSALGYDLGLTYKVLINNQTAAQNATVQAGDIVHVSAVSSTNETNSGNNVFPLKLNGQDFAFAWDKKTPPILSDIFPLLDLELFPRHHKHNLKMAVNGQAAGFTTVLKPGDEVLIKWE